MTGTSREGLTAHGFSLYEEGFQPDGFIPSGRILCARVLVQKEQEREYTHASMLQALTCKHTWIMKWLEAKPWAHMVITYMY